MHNFSDYCCDWLEVKLYDAANETQGVRSGIYERQTELVNGYSHWKREGDGKYVIWLNSEEGRWTIGSSVGSGGGIFSSFNGCPSRAVGTWQYYNGSNSFQDAGENITVQCLGNNFHQL